MRLAEKAAIVTGAASGFGGGIARCFAAEGAKVIVADRDADKGAAMAATIEDAGGTAVFAHVDVSKADDIQAMVDLAVERFGGLDILVNNAGIGQRPTPIGEITDAEYDRLFDVNVRGVFLCCRTALPALRQGNDGCIINTSSGIALRARPNMAPYGATKAAVSAMTQSLALELAPEGIRVNALCPGAGDTPMLAEFMGGTESREKRDLFVSGIPLGRLISPEDMGMAAVYLASDEAAMITGTFLPVDGGRCI